MFTLHQLTASLPVNGFTHQRLDVALHRMVVTAQVSHEAKAWQDEVIIVRLATVQKPEKLVKGHKVPVVSAYLVLTCLPQEM